MVHTGSFVTPTSDTEITNTQAKFDRYIRDWLFLQVVGENGERMVIYKQVSSHRAMPRLLAFEAGVGADSEVQQYNSESECKVARDRVSEMPGATCLPVNYNLPSRTVTNQHGSGFYYLFYGTLCSMDLPEIT